MIRRKYRGESDQERIRQFLQNVFLLNGRREYSWPLYRWDYWVWHVNANIYHFDLSAAVFLWENEAGQLIAVLNPDHPGEAFLQTHPHYRSADLEVEMMSVAETQYAVAQPDGSQTLTIWCPAGDKLRQDILTRRGYTRQSDLEFQRQRDSQLPVADVPPAAGYTIRALGGEEELPARSWVSWKAFHPDEPDSRYQGWEWYRNIQRAPFYRRDLDLVAVAPNGEFAGFCTIWYDSETCTASLEPVGTHPDHQRKGVGKALLAEGLRRVHQLGATLVTVDSYSDRAGALYASAGFTRYDLSEPWLKQW